MALSSKVFTIGLVGAWYCSNIGVLLLNKYLLSNYGFRFPIFLTMCHMTACALLSYVGITWFKMVPMQAIRSRQQLLKIAALSTIFCGSVVGGVIIASGGEPSFHLYGFIMCILATAARALKTVLQGILLSSEGEKLNSMNLLLYMAPIAVVVLLPAVMILEPNVLGITVALARQDMRIVYYLLFNSGLAYFVNLTNFLVTKHTSALTLQVLGNAKGAVAVVVSILLFRNPVSVTGMLGYTLTVCGVILYSEAKRRFK
ncbi:hypothetical protein SUGI_1004280 [Cryptomeria japonica]|nr:hypothetical protein SUGI_1004280 [Cryptomeria japonica]